MNTTVAAGRVEQLTQAKRSIDKQLRQVNQQIRDAGPSAGAYRLQKLQLQDRSQTLARQIKAAKQGGQQLEASEALEATSAPRKARKVGYGRVSTEHQSEAQQKAQLEAAGCTEVITETISSGRKERPGLARVLQELQPGDTLVICKLDRLARSLQELLAIAADLEARGVNLQVLDQAIDTTTPTGRLLFQLLGAVGEFERQLAIERTRASVEHRRSTGGSLGGRPKSYTAEQHRLGLRLKAEGESVSGVARALGISRATAGRLLQEPLQEATS
jgi:DNA invertase Pin-like site-specific DNA recombinase